ncbi:serine/threonine protein kinase [Streptomyces actuosus]|uniref:non-specific serine/threonine protein kinase n=1 Tax=Streptomyces actuosus TaxID=1885 RepID=A0ABS2VML0_STRAS|nr:serine/threonine-protein kinase [Streptomyces actuosus]MBN0044286.1 serine/threonine protein kinase [Streptomyces actuosus]
MSDGGGVSDGGGSGASGRLVGGRYRLLERIGGSPDGSGSVWRALDEHTEREVAVRQPWPAVRPGDDGYRRAAHRLLHEARAAARVDHPSAVFVHDVVAGEDGGPPWQVMELVPGESLRRRIARAPLDPVEAARLGLAVLGALRAAHAVGIVHRDVRPANVLLDPAGRVVLAGFGIEAPVGGGAFQAPERRAGRRGGPASDLWSLGALLREAVGEETGALGVLVGRLLAPEPETRPGAAETAAALEAVAAGRPAAVADLGAGEPAAVDPVPAGEPAPAAAARETARSTTVFAAPRTGRSAFSRGTPEPDGSITASAPAEAARSAAAPAAPDGAGAARAPAAPHAARPVEVAESAAEGGPVSPGEPSETVRPAASASHPSSGPTGPESGEKRRLAPMTALRAALGWAKG